MKDKYYLAKTYGLFALVIFTGVFFTLLYGFVIYSSQNKSLRQENNDLRGQVSQMIKEKSAVEKEVEILEETMEMKESTAEVTTEAL